MALSAVQLGHARTITAVVRAMGLPVRCLVIALETALDESSLLVYANAHNPKSLRLPHDAVGSDHASVGIFQQQPGDAPGSVVNWGTTHDCMDPALSAGKFLRALQRHPWQQMSNWAAAQAVQVSAYPSGSNYQRFDGEATQLATQLWAEHQPTPAPIKRRRAMFVYYVPNIPGGGGNCFTFNGKDVRQVHGSANYAAALAALGQAKGEPIDNAQHQEWLAKSG